MNYSDGEIEEAFTAAFRADLDQKREAHFWKLRRAAGRAAAFEIQKQAGQRLNTPAADLYSAAKDLCLSLDEGSADQIVKLFHARKKAGSRLPLIEEMKNRAAIEEEVDREYELHGDPEIYAYCPFLGTEATLGDFQSLLDQILSSATSKQAQRFPNRQTIRASVQADDTQEVIAIRKDRKPADQPSPTFFPRSDRPTVGPPSPRTEQAPGLNLQGVA